ncbi:MAG: hypothetical protein AAGF10_04585 [Verrucomicrobiota bacterium]
MKKTHHTFFITAIIMVALALQQLAAEQNQPGEIKPSADAEDRIATILEKGGDIFNYSYDQRNISGNNDLIPVDISQLSAEVKLKGVFIIDTQNPAALVQIGEEAVRYIVKEGDLLPLRSPERNDRGLFSNNEKRTEQQYLLIIEIDENSITVAPKKRPDELITIR